MLGPSKQNPSPGWRPQQTSVPSQFGGRSARSRCGQLGFSEASLLPLQTATFSLGPHADLPRCVRIPGVRLCVFTFPALVRTPSRLDEGPAYWPQFTLITSFKAPPLPGAGTLAEGGELCANAVLVPVHTQHPPGPRLCVC